VEDLAAGLQGAAEDLRLLVAGAAGGATADHAAGTLL